MTSLYVWEGKLQEDGESAMIIKTTRGRVEEVLAEIKRLHPYSIPARLVVPVAGGGEDFLHWIAGQCSERS
jgi:periplasmic divalent cation tolerance protein